MPTRTKRPVRAVPISVVIFEDADKWLRENLPDMHADSVACVYPLTRFYPDGHTPYVDREELTEAQYEAIQSGDSLAGITAIKQLTMADHLRALLLLSEQVGDTLFVGGLKSPKDLVDPGNWDVEVVDAFYQLVYYGRVIYG